MTPEQTIKTIQDNLFDQVALPESLSFKAAPSFEYPPETDWERGIREQIGEDWL